MDAAWNKEHQTTGLAWTVTGLPSTKSLQGSWIQDVVRSPQIGEAFAVRSSLYQAAALDITALRVCSDN